MIYIYNATDNAYLDIEAYLTELETALAAAEESGDPITTVYQVLFLHDLASLFTLAKKRTALRGRYAKGQQGESLMEVYAMTDDEQDFFDDTIKTAAAEVFKRLSAYSKTIDQAYRHDVSFGDPVVSGTAEIVANNVITDSGLALTPNALIGYKLVITTPGLLANQERVIASNTATTITLATAFDSDISGLDFAIFTQTNKYIAYYLLAASTWDNNMLQGIENAIQEALVTYIIKEWYLINRFMDDFSIEEGRYLNDLRKINSHLYQSKKPVRRPADFFS